MTNPRADVAAHEKDGSIEAKPWARVACGLFGAAGVGSGGLAVFTTQVEAGPVALILFGAVMLIISASGYFPSRVKFGDGEAAWQRQVGAIVAKVVENVPADSRDIIQPSIDELSRISPIAGAAPLRSLARGRSLRELIRSLDMNDVKIDVDFVTPQGGVDAIAISESGVRVLIEITEFHLRGRDILPGLHRLGAMLDDGLADAAIILTVMVPSAQARKYLDSDPRIILAVASNAGDDTELVAALRTAIDLNPDPT